MLAVARHLTLIGLLWLTSGRFAEGLGNLALHCIQQEVNVLAACKLLSVLHDQSDTLRMLPVLLVLIDKALAICLIRQKYLGHGEVLDSLIEVIEGSESLATPRESLVVQISVLCVALVEHFGVLEHSCAVIYHVLPHL